VNPGEGFEAAAARAYAQGIHPLTFTETVLAVIVAYETGRRLDDPYAEQLACWKEQQDSEPEGPDH